MDVKKIINNVDLEDQQNAKNISNNGQGNMA